MNVFKAIFNLAKFIQENHEDIAAIADAFEKGVALVKKAESEGIFSDMKKATTPAAQ